LTELDATPEPGGRSEGGPDAGSRAGGPLPALRELTGLLLAAETVEGVLGRVVTAAREVVPGAELVSITLRHEDGTSETPVGTGKEAVELDQAQYRAGNGPCVDSADPDGPAYALCGDLAGRTPWPAFAANAIDHGYHSVLSTALLPGPGPVPFTGALNIYASRTDAFDDDARDLAFLLATHASLALALAHTRRDLAEAESEGANLRAALDSRTVIAEATGILMARRHLTAEEAFEVLRRTSQNRNVKLARLAAILTGAPHVADRL
jgi:GAF domain-containing protein